MYMYKQHLGKHRDDKWAQKINNLIVDTIPAVVANTRSASATKSLPLPPLASITLSPNLLSDPIPTLCLVLVWERD